MSKKMSLFGGPTTVSAPNSGRTSPVHVDDTTASTTTVNLTSTTTTTRERSSSTAHGRNRHTGLLVRRSATMFYPISSTAADTMAAPAGLSPISSPFHLFNLPQGTRPMFEAIGITTPVASPAVAQYVPQACVQISPQGDMALKVSSAAGETRFVVDSHVLCLASPVFRAMLGPNFKEGHDLRHAEEVEEEYVLPLLDDDNIEAFEIILNAIHLQNAKVPQTVSYETLLELAVIVEKYQMYQAITPWVYQWTHTSKPHALEPGFEGWLFVAWVLRDDKIFTELSAKLIKGSCKKVDGLVTRSGRVFDRNIPQAVLNAIAQRRSEAVSGLLKICHYYYSKYTTWTLPPGSLCGHPDGHLCDTMMLGALMKAFGPAGLLPGEADAAAVKSIDELRDTVETLQPVVFDCVRSKLCIPTPGPGLRAPARCAKHGELRDCPGPLFHESCSFLPALTIEVEHLVGGVRGLDLNDFSSRAIV